MALTKDELLKERYKVIALWPRCRAQVGDILISSVVNAKACWVSTRPGNDSMGTIKDSHPPSNIIRGPEFFPHLFQKMEWWQERALTDMPEYVKVNTENTALFLGNIFKVRMWKIRAAGLFYCWLEEDKRKSMADLFEYDPENFLPATQEEYNAYIQKQTTNG